MSAVAARVVPLRPPGRATMLRVLVVRGVRDNRLAPLTWGGALGALCALMAGLYPSMEDAIARIMEIYPRNVLDAFGVSRIDSLESWLHAEMFSIIVPLALSYLAARSATRLLAEAEERGHLDTLLATPLPRSLLVVGSFLTTAIVLAAVLVVVGALPLVVGLAVGEAPSVSVLLAGLVAVWAVALFFAGVAVLAAGMLHRAATVTGIAAGALGLMYTLDFLGKAVDAMEPFRWLSAFRYYGAPMVDGFDLGAVAILVSAAIVLATIGGWLFERRDIRAR